MTVRMPYQLFINGEFVDSSNGRTFDCINPTDGSVRNTFICESLDKIAKCFAFFVNVFLLCFFCPKVLTKVSFASVEDVDKAVAAAKVMLILIKLICSFYEALNYI